MDVYIDGAALPTEQESDAVVGDIVDNIRGRLAANRRLLVGVRCDDRDAAGADIEPLLAEPLAQFQRVEFTTASADDLATDLLEQISGLLAETRPVQSEVVELLAQGSTARAMELLAGCLPIWSQSQEGLCRATEVLGLDLDTVPFEGAPVAEFICQLAEALSNLRDALESRDYVALADVLAYEMEPVTQRWERLNTALVAHAEPGVG